MTGGAAGADAVPARGRPALVVLALMLVVYGIGVCPVVFWGDSAELSRRALTVELLPTARGYPLHRVLCWAAGCVAGDAALGANCVSALFGAISVALVFEIARSLERSTWAAATAAAVTGLAHTFWMYSEVAEVYTLHTALMLGAILLAIRCDGGGVRARVALGAVLGFSLLHHRMIVFAVPGLVWWMWTGVAPGARRRAVLQVVAGAVAGAVPFAVLCVVASRTPPPGTANAAWWWFQDVFMGGERNSDFLLGDGRKGLVRSAAYLGKWLVLNLPGPALVLAAAGFAKARARVAVFLGIEALANLWFPLRYDWTGDQYTFLIPVFPVLALAAAVAVGRLEAARGVRAARAAFACAALAPVACYALLAGTAAGPALLPGLRPEAVRSTFRPPRTGDRTSFDWCAARLGSLPQGARLHADWGDGEVYLYLQEARGMRRDVSVMIWNRNQNKSIALEPGEWLSVVPIGKELPEIVASVAARLEPRGDGLFRVKSE